MTLMRSSAFLLFVFVSFSAAPAQDSPGAVLRQGILDLSNDCVLMDLSAHPDDEDGASLAFYRMKYGVKTHSILFTRGEGGQNEKGPELYEQLGALRSVETEQAGRILGTDVYFLNFLDFGYSKTASEAFRMWGGQKEVLRRLVYVIRKYKPDVLFTNHNTIDGHGHHQAVAIAAIAAFDAAGDSTYFPEQLREPGITRWQPRKLFFRAFGKSEPTADVSNAINERAPGAELTYLDIASGAMRMHRTQGLERADLRAFTRGKNLYKLVRTKSLYDMDSTSFFSGINLFHDPSVALLAPLRDDLNRLDPIMPRDSIAGLVSSVLARCDSLRASGGLSVLARRMLAHWEAEGGNLVAAACGLTADCRLRDATVVPGQRVPCDLTVRSTVCSLSGVRWSFTVPDGWVMQEETETAPRLSGGSDERAYMLTVGENARLTLPRTATQYSPLEGRQELVGHVSFMAERRRLTLTVKPLFDIAPKQEIEIAPRASALLRSRVKEGVALEYVIRNFLPHKSAGRIGIRAPAGWSGDNASFVIDHEDSVARGRLVVRPPADVAPGEYIVHVRTETASEPVTISVIEPALAPGIRVGIVKSYDTTLESVATTLGVNYALLSDADLASGDLSRFTTIVIDIRAYLVREALRLNNARLLSYVREGGNVVVMYQREQEWKPEYAPYPFQVSRKRVCDEEAPVTIIEKSHPLMTSPNLIGEPDWKAWKQERAVYVPSDVSEKYTRLLSSGDPDEPPLTTGYLAAPFGKGSYMYTSFVWYRQMKEGNPGSFRCFANMISYPAFRLSTP